MCPVRFSVSASALPNLALSHARTGFRIPFAQQEEKKKSPRLVRGGTYLVDGAVVDAEEVDVLESRSPILCVAVNVSLLSRW